MTEKNDTSAASSKRARRDSGASDATSRRALKNAQIARNRGRNKNKSRPANDSAMSDQARRDAALGRSVPEPDAAPTTAKKAVKKHPQKQPQKHLRKHTAKHTAKHTPKHASKKATKKGGRRGGGGGRGRSRFGQPQTNAERLLDVTAANGDQNAPKIPTIEKDTMRIIPIGGNEEVGRNMIMVEYGTGGGKSDIVIMDTGMQFAEEDMHGIDYIVPNVSYLRGKERNILGVLYTHGHLDHIGAAPVVLKQLGYPPVIARDLTLALIKKKVDDGDPGASERLKTISVKDIDKKMTLGMFNISFFEVDHSIMDCMGIALATPVGTAINLGDWMISKEPAGGVEPVTYEHLKDLPAPRILLLESLGSVKKAATSEKLIQGNLEELITDAPGRVILATFASQVKRIKLLLEFCEKAGRKVALDGYSMRTNVEIAKELGYMKFDSDVLIPINDIHKYPDKKVLVLCTGAQGEHNASLNKMVTENHRFIKLQRDDTVVFSSSVIPGNERAIGRLKDNLYRKCDNVIHNELMDVHIGGHANANDIQEVIRMAEPQYFIPVYAHHYMLKESANRAVEMGFPRGKIAILDNGQIIEFTKQGAKVRKEKADSSYVFVDGLGIGDVGQVVLRDRQALAEDGMFVINAILDAKSKKVVSMQVTSRGFVFVKDNFETINEAKKKVEDIIKRSTSEDTQIDWRHVENNVRDEIGEFLFQKTARRPMVLPIIMEV